MNGLEQVIEISVVVVVVAVVAALVAVFAAIGLFLYQRNRILNLEDKRSIQDDNLNEAQKTIEESQQKANSIEEELSQAKDKIIHLEAEKNSKEELLGSVRSDVERERQAKEEAQKQVTEVSKQTSKLESDLQNTRARLTDQESFLENATQKLSDAFGSLSGKALAENRTELLGDLQRAQNTSQQAVGSLVEPVKISLDGLNTSHARLDEGIGNLLRSTGNLDETARNLSKVLGQPGARGEWGELQLQRCVELAGMKRYVDFDKQQQLQSESGGSLKPDLIVHLPNERKIVVDSKASMTAFRAAMETQDEQQREARLKEHAKQVRDRVRELSKRDYQNVASLGQTPDFVVMFIPGEVFYSAALEQDPELIEFSLNNKVLIASPTILIALFRAVYVGWQEVDVAQKARIIRDQSNQLMRCTRILIGHMEKIQKGLERAVSGWNDAVGSLNSTYVPHVDRLSELVDSSEDIPELIEISDAIRGGLRQPKHNPLLPEIGEEGSVSETSGEGLNIDPTAGAALIDEKPEEGNHQN